MSHLTQIGAAPLASRLTAWKKVALLVAGEIVVIKTDFERLNAQRAAAGQPLFANPRNGRRHN